MSGARPRFFMPLPTDRKVIFIDMEHAAPLPIHRIDPKEALASLACRRLARECLVCDHLWSNKARLAVQAWRAKEMTK